MLVGFNHALVLQYTSVYILGFLGLSFDPGLLLHFDIDRRGFLRAVRSHIHVYVVVEEHSLDVLTINVGLDLSISFILLQELNSLDLLLQLLVVVIIQAQVLGTYCLHEATQFADLRSSNRCGGLVTIMLRLFLLSVQSL